MLFVMVYGDDDHYHVNYIKAEEAGKPCLHILLSAISGGDCTKQNNLEGACSSGEFL